MLFANTTLWRCSLTAHFNNKKMAYLGKTFAVESETNYVEFIKSLGLPEDQTAKYAAYKPKTKLEKEGDTYKVTSETPEGSRVTEFKSGVPFVDNFNPDVTFNSVYTVKGDTVTQVIEKDGKSVTFKREYSPDKLKMTIISSYWDGEAVRNYKAV